MPDDLPAEEIEQSIAHDRQPPAPAPQEQTYTQAEVDAMVRKIALLNAALEESDQLARAGEKVGYESAFRVLRRVVAQVLDTPPPALRRRVAGVPRSEIPMSGSPPHTRFSPATEERLAKIEKAEGIDRAELVRRALGWYVWTVHERELGTR